MQNMHIFALQLTIRHFIQAEPRGDKSIVLCKVLESPLDGQLVRILDFLASKAPFTKAVILFFYNQNKSQFECMKYVLTPTLVPHEWSLTRMAKESLVLQGKAQEHNYG